MQKSTRLLNAIQYYISTEKILDEYQFHLSDGPSLKIKHLYKYKLLVNMVIAINIHLFAIKPFIITMLMM